MQCTVRKGRCLAGTYAPRDSSALPQMSSSHASQVPCVPWDLKIQPSVHLAHIVSVAMCSLHYAWRVTIARPLLLRYCVPLAPTALQEASRLQIAPRGRIAKSDKGPPLLANLGSIAKRIATPCRIAPQVTSAQTQVGCRDAMQRTTVVPERCFHRCARPVSTAPIPLCNYLVLAVVTIVHLGS